MDTKVFNPQSFLGISPETLDVVHICNKKNSARFCNVALKHEFLYALRKFFCRRTKTFADQHKFLVVFYVVFDTVYRKQWIINVMFI